MGFISSLDSNLLYVLLCFYSLTYVHSVTSKFCFQQKVSLLGSDSSLSTHPE